MYSCDVCGQQIYFENTQCVNCKSQLGYLPVLDNMSSLEIVEGIVYKALAPQAQGAVYKKCKNNYQENVCNWMIPQEISEDLCLSCRLNDMIPDLSFSENRISWNRLEIAKRRLIYSLLRLGLPLNSKDDDSVNGLAFSFLAEAKRPQLKETKKLMIGHEQGKITFNIAEANDAVREKMRLDMNERYRTLLGHFRHEIGHYYWFLLIENNIELLMQFRQLFGDEQIDYNQSLKAYYKDGAPHDWQSQYISAYASAHPWEDWAESWAHYLHMFDTLETARAWGVSVKFKTGTNIQEINLENPAQSFEDMQNQWLHLSCTLNSLNRSMGLKDAYPFIWSSAVVAKLQFIHQLINYVNQEVKA